jgi:ribosome-associated protein
VNELTNKRMTPRKLLNAALRDLDDLKALQVVALNVKKLSPMMDYMVIATGTSSKHIHSIADFLCKNMKERDITPLGVEGDDEWILVDLGDIIVHIMQSQAREFYNLEKLWSVNVNPKTRSKPMSA